MKTETRFKIFLNKLNTKGKTGIRLPKKEKDANIEKHSLSQLLDKQMISKSTYCRKIEEINSITLDDEMYREFYYLLQQ